MLRPFIVKVSVLGYFPPVAPNLGCSIAGTIFIDPNLYGLLVVPPGWDVGVTCKLDVLIL